MRVAAAAATAVAALAAAPASRTLAQAPGQTHEGAAALGLALRKLGTTKRVLMVGAHPDDENTALLAELALGEGADVAYLSLTRGEGGQDLIGPQLEEGLGLIRTEELLAARRLDGARQFFARTYDFGFSKNADESFGHWPRDSVLSDVVAVIRRFRPDVLVPVFSGTPRDGHGQHQVSGIVAREAFHAAADPARFPEQIRAGLRPWQPKYLVQALYRPQGEIRLRVETGAYDPLLGRSYFQVAMASRSRHRSQDMGQAQPPGPRTVALDPQMGGFPAGAHSLFTGIDTTLTQWAGDVDAAPAGARARVLATLGAYRDAVAAAKARFNPLEEAPTRAALLRAVTLLASADSAAAALPADAAAELRFRIAAERAQAQHAAWEASDVVFDATADAQRVVPGESFELTLTLWNGGDTPVRIAALEPLLPEGWSARPLADEGTVVPPQTLARRAFRVEIPRDARPTEPYYLRRPRNGDLYAWPDDPSLRGLPFEPARVRAAASVEVGGVVLTRDEDATFVDVDKAQGERRLPILVVPAVSVAVSPDVAVVPVGAPAAGGAASDRSRVFTVQLLGEAAKPLSGTVRLTAPAGWTVEPASVPVSFERPGDERAARFTVRPPASPAAGEVEVHARFEAADGRGYARGYTVIDYPHIRPRTLYHDATSIVSVFPVTVPAGLRVGYVMGAGDDGPEALRQMGVSVDLLDARALAAGDLSRYDAVVTGIRAFEVRPDLTSHNDRLLRYVQNGGTLVVQYNKYELPQGGYAPYPFSIARPHDRVTDEDAAVTLLKPDARALSWPNRITPADFEGWIQDKGLYFAHEWDPHYTPLLSMHDPGDPPLEGGLLVAPYGKGTYVYTGLAFFRQLPAGVPGAYRLLANLVSLGQH